MKTCNTCDTAKPFGEFYLNKGVPMGRCKDCHRAAVRVLYMDKIKDEDWREEELLRHRLKAKRARDEGRDAAPEIIRKSKRAWDYRNQEKKRCHAQVSRAIRAGTLIRKPCEKCGRTDDVEAHHDDYSKPLEVNWLCPRHHADRHLELNREKRRERYATPNPAGAD